MSHDLTPEAAAGFNAIDADPSALFSSPAWLAFRAGQAVRNAGFPGIKSAAMSRGYSVRVTGSDGRAVIVAFAGDDLDALTIKPAPAARRCAF